MPEPIYIVAFVLLFALVALILGAAFGRTTFTSAGSRALARAKRAMATGLSRGDLDRILADEAAKAFKAGDHVAARAILQHHSLGAWVYRSLEGDYGPKVELGTGVQ